MTRRFELFASLVALGLLVAFPVAVALFWFWLQCG